MADKLYNYEGRYYAEIVEASVAPAENGKNPVVILPLDLVAKYAKQFPPRDGDDVAEECKKPRYHPRVFLPISEKTMGTPDQPGWVARTLAFLGFDGDFDNIAQFNGWKGQVKCNHVPNTKEGGLREQWDILRPNDSQPIKPAEKKDTRTLNTLYGKVFKSAATPVITPAKPAPTPAPSPEPAAYDDGNSATAVAEMDGDDIPF